MSRIVITGLGILSAVGRGRAVTLAALRAGRSGLGPLTHFASPRCGHLPVAEVREPLAGRLPRTVLLAEPALRDALAEARLDPGAGPVGLVVGCTVGGMPETEEVLEALLAGESPPEVRLWRQHECGATSALLADRVRLRGPVSTVSSACSSGALAIATACELLDAGLADAMLAGGVDALCRLTLNGFASLLAVDPQGCRPFDRARRGMSLGEGAAFLALEREDTARARGVRPLAVLAGFANTCDAHHITGPDPQGCGAEAAMRGALAAAGLEPGAVDYLNAHGTGTPDNDRAEGRAIRRVFGEALPPVSSTKRVFGHTLAAAGAIEAGVGLLAIAEGFLPPNPGFREPDPECGIVPVREARPAAVRTVLSNSFGFGGSNLALCLRAWEEGA